MSTKGSSKRSLSPQNSAGYKPKTSYDLPSSKTANYTYDPNDPNRISIPSGPSSKKSHMPGINFVFQADPTLFAPPGGVPKGPALKIAKTATTKTAGTAAPTGSLTTGLRSGEDEDDIKSPKGQLPVRNVRDVPWNAIVPEHEAFGGKGVEEVKEAQREEKEEEEGQKGKGWGWFNK